MAASASYVLQPIWDLLRNSRDKIEELEERLNDVNLQDHLLSQLEIKKEEAAHRNTRQGTLLHMVASHQNSFLLSSVVTLYKRRGCLGKALMSRNVFQETPLLCTLAIYDTDLTNFMYLYELCEEHAPGAIQMTTEIGLNVFHVALKWSPLPSTSVAIISYLVEKEICQPLLFQSADIDGYPNGVTPLEFVKHFEERQKSKISMDKRFNKTPSDNDLNSLDNFRDVRLLMEKAAAKLEVVSLRKRAEIKEKERIEKKQKEIQSLVTQHLEADNWSIAVKFLFSDDEEAAFMALDMIVAYVMSSDLRAEKELPLDRPTVTRLRDLLEYSSEAIFSVVWYLICAATDTTRIEYIWHEDRLLDKIVSNLTLPSVELQTACTELLKCIFECKGDRDVSSWIQPLQIVKEFSNSSHAKRAAGHLLDHMDVPHRVDLSTWTPKDVSRWLMNQKQLGPYEVYSKKFLERNIGGLQLMEISPPDLAAMGIHNPTEQEKITEIIDNLRLLNKKGQIGKKDVFLSYSHVNLQTARKIKKALNAAGYTVWIDESGIRPGHKWRNEIAEGIQNSKAFVFLMTKRSATSIYCHDELGLAEDMKKSIFTAHYENITNIDPGLRLIIMSRQWVSFQDEDNFEKSIAHLIDALKENHISPSSTEETLKEEEAEIQEDAEPPKHHSFSGGHSSSSHTIPVSEKEVSNELEEWKESIQVLFKNMEDRIVKIEKKIAKISQ